MSDKVVTLNGDPVSGISGTISKSLILNLEDLLERAKSGKIVGAVIIAVSPDILCSYRMNGFNINSYQMLGALTTVKQLITADVIDDIENDPRPPPVS